VPVPEWQPAARPTGKRLTGRFAVVERLTLDHVTDLFDAFSADAEGRCWTYLPYGPFDSVESYREWVVDAIAGDDPLFHAVVDRADGRAVGVASLLRITPAAGSIEVGHLNFSPRLQRSAVGSEAMFLLMQLVFDELGYRRYEWKCNSLNGASTRAAKRYGFTFEGTFRQANVVKGRNRDTAWFSIIDAEWPRVRHAFRSWLEPSNIDQAGRQRLPLRAAVDRCDGTDGLD
jgi:RimJ/RimL family protein N-acetyltransferase